MSWPPPGRRLLPREAASILYQAGWKDAINLPIMVAVCQQESQFYCEAVSPTNPDGTQDFGFCQMNSSHWSRFGAASVDDFRVACFDPAKCASYARKLYVDGGFNPWVAYTSGAYKRFLGNAVIGAANMAADHFALSPIPYVKAA